MQLAARTPGAANQLWPSDNSGELSALGTANPQRLGEWEKHHGNKEKGAFYSLHPHLPSLLRKKDESV